VDRIWHIAEAIIGSAIGRPTAIDFLKWEQANPTELRRRDNKFRDSAGTPAVEVRMGSIHSIKGETHTATLVLETYFKKHHLEALKPWLLGEKTGGDGQNDLTKSRLRQHYVALTRPTHLLCLALRESSLSPDEINTLKARGWRVGRIGSDKMDWP
jgi:DNA helicase-2/ATP-dependent DNA helicase PcrA